MDLQGRTALVTGAGLVGREIAATLAAHGAGTVVVCDLARANADEAADAVREAGAEAVPVVADLTDLTSVGRLAEAAAAVASPVQIVVNSAGIATTGPAMDVDEAQWQSVIDTNLNGAWRVAQRAARMMRDAGTGGSIINIASILGLRVAQQVPDGVPDDWRSR